MTSQSIGSGTYDDPISFATATDNKQNLPQCAIVYVPLLRKYFRNEDDCAECCKYLSDLSLDGVSNELSKSFSDRLGLEEGIPH